MTDLIERLRRIPTDLIVTRFDGVTENAGKWAHESSDEIERLRRELAEARELLTQSTLAVHRSAEYGQQAWAIQLLDRIGSFLNREDQP